MSLLEMAQEISEYVVKDLGDQVKLTLPYGSAARGEVTQFSDLDILVITYSASYQRASVLKGRPVEIWSMTLEECKKLITDTS